MLRPSSGSILGSSRAAQRRAVRAERARAAGQVARFFAGLTGGTVGGVFELVLLCGLPVLYAVASFLFLALPLRLAFGGARFSLVGLLAWLAAAGLSVLGVVRAAQGAEPIAPVRPAFARNLLILMWIFSAVLAVADLSR